LRNALRRWLAPAILLLSFAAPAHAEDTAAFPSKPIRVIVPSPPGAGTDVGGRLVSEAAEKFLGQRLVIENKPGAGGRIGTSFVAKATPDGYTLLYAPKTTLTIAQFTSQKLDFDPGRDLTPVAIMTWAPALLIVRKDFPANTMQEFIAYAKQNPGKITFGIQGIGSELHLLLEILRTRAGVNILAVPYSGGAPAIVDMLAGRLDAMFLVPVAVKAHVQAGRLKALATLDPQRAPDFPNLPTTADVGLPNVTSTSWFGFVAPAATPPAIIAKLADAFKRTQGNAVVVKKLADLGYALRVKGPAESTAIFAEERAEYSKIAAGGRLDRAN
jgi:tripartite-type tricarboxylate transporter receptor subunit TctC